MTEISICRCFLLKTLANIIHMSVYTLALLTILDPVKIHHADLARR